MKQKLLFLLRIVMGWLYFYTGLIKILNPTWSAAGYIGGAKTFPGFYNLFLRSDILPFTNYLNEWALTLLGISLIAGVFVKYAGYLGSLLMLLYYLPILDFPKVGANSFIVDDHIIFILVLLYLSVAGAGEYLGFDGWWKSRKK